MGRSVFPARVCAVWSPRRAVHRGRHGCGESHLCGTCSHGDNAQPLARRQGAQQPRVHRERGRQPRHASGGLDPGVGGHGRPRGAHARGELHRIRQRPQHRHQRADWFCVRGGNKHRWRRASRHRHFQSRGPFCGGHQRRSLHPRRPGGALRRPRHGLRRQGSGVLLQRQRWGGHRGRDRQIGHGANCRVQLQPIGLHPPRVVERRWKVLVLQRRTGREQLRQRHPHVHRRRVEPGCPGGDWVLRSGQHVCGPQPLRARQQDFRVQLPQRLACVGNRPQRQFDPIRLLRHQPRHGFCGVLRHVEQLSLLPER